MFEFAIRNAAACALNAEGRYHSQIRYFKDVQAEQGGRLLHLAKL